MAWTDRQLQATYTSPSGASFIFQYESVSVESDLKTSTFIFPEVEGAFIQDLGRAGRRYPFTVFFSGADYDVISDAFLSALEEKGVGTLIHPLYGIKSVIPTGSISRKDDLLNESNQASFSISFSETITGLTFPSSTENAVENIGSAISLFQAGTSDQFANDIDVNSASESISLKQVFEKQRFVIENAFEMMIKINEDINSAFQIVSNSLKEEISNIVEFPDIVSSQLITLMRIPSKIDIDIADKITQYENIVNGEIEKPTYEKSISSNEPDNAFTSAIVQVFSSIIAMCESVLGSEFKTRPEALDVSGKILDIFDDVKLWQDTNITSLEIVDIGVAYDTLLTVISLTTAYLINLSFDLPAEKIKILGEDRNIIELVSELYGDLDQIDFFIQTNNLTCDEIEILSQGKSVVYYA